VSKAGLHYTRNAGDLWAITSYFNPIGYKRRLENYKLFREYLKLPLVTVELAYGPDFELKDEDAEVLVQLRGKDILWQKERLLNIALQTLPPSCKKVAWVDCDVVFTADDWAERTCRLLDRSILVQLFNRIYHVRRNWRPGDDWQQPPCELRHSVAFWSQRAFLPLPAWGANSSSSSRLLVLYGQHDESCWRSSTSTTPASWVEGTVLLPVRLTGASRKQSSISR
jgi:hypothetical protein